MQITRIYTWQSSHSQHSLYRGVDSVSNCLCKSVTRYEKIAHVRNGDSCLIEHFQNQDLGIPFDRNLLYYISSIARRNEGCTAKLEMKVDC